jgi:hypothetical protein
MATALVRWSAGSTERRTHQTMALFQPPVTSSCLHSSLDSGSTLQLPSAPFAQYKTIAKTTGVAQELIVFCSY